MGRRLVVVLFALSAALVVPGVAGAAPVPISNVVAKPIKFGGTCAPGTAEPVDAPAGTHRDVCLAFNFDTGPGPAKDDVKDVTISLPAGVVGDPGATGSTPSSRCSMTAFNGGTCAASTRVGDVSSAVTISGLISTTVSGEVYNLQPAGDEPARLGISLDQNLAGGLAPVHLPVPIRVRVADAGLDSVTNNIPNNANGISLQVHSMALTMWGSNADLPGTANDRHTTMAKPFMSLPTRCDAPAQSVITVTSYGGQKTTATTSFNVTNCDKVPWDPGLEVGPTTAPADTPGEAWAKLIVPTTDTGTGDNARRQAYLKDVALHLPPGLAINPPLANGLEPCTPEQFGFGIDAPPGCAPSTEMGTVEFRTPIFPGQVLGGKVYFGTPEPGRPLVNFISVEDPRLRLKLGGYATIDPVTTAVTAHFENQPQVPFESFKFTYTAPGEDGARATLTSPVACGNYPVTAEMTPWMATTEPLAGAPKSPTKTFEVNDCHPPVFAPTVSAAVSNPQAGSDTGLIVRIERPDKNLRLKRMTVSMPAGLTGRLTAVPACKVADARASKCPDESQVGTAAVKVGTGKAPLGLPGKVFLTEGYDGAIAGLAVEVNTKVPAMDLGKVTVLNKIYLRPDTGLDVVSEDLPQSLEGIPTVYRTIELNINKTGFMRNATSCAAQAVHATFTAADGTTTATSDSPYQATGCESLPFAPKLTAKIGAPNEVAKFQHPPLQVTIEQADGESAMSKTVVTLPDGIGVDLKNLGGLCTSDQLNSGSCPANSKIGDVSAETPLLPQKLTGGVYLLKPDKPGLPGIALDLGGLVRLKGSVALIGRLTTTFEGVPDVPLRRLVLNLTGGPKGALTSSKDICGSKSMFDAQYTSHTGIQRSASVPAEVVGCGVLSGSGQLSVRGRLSGVAKKRPALRLDVRSGDPLKQLRVTLPKALRPLSSKKLRRSGRLLVAGRKAKGSSVAWSGGRLVVKPAAGTSLKTASLSLPAGVLRLIKRIKPGSNVTFVVTALGADGKTRKATIKLRAGR